MQFRDRARALLLVSVVLLVLIICTADASPRERTGLSRRGGSSDASTRRAAGEGDGRGRKRNRGSGKGRGKGGKRRKGGKNGVRKGGKRDEERIVVAPVASLSEATRANGCECGRRRLSARVVGGQDAEKGDFPWQVALVKARNGNYFCSGSIINDLYVLTAAHCVQEYKKDPKKIKAVLAELDRAQADETKERTVGIDKIIIHRDYLNTNNALLNDIALLKLSKKLKFTDRKEYSPVCLPERTSQLYNDKTAMFAGWGRTAIGGQNGQNADILQETHLNVISNEECRAAGYLDSFVNSKVLCAEDGGNGPYTGDAGGALVYDRGNSVFEQIGIASFGRVNQGELLPTGFVRVSKYLNWIEKNDNGATYCN